MIKLHKTQKSKTILKNPPNKNAIFNRQHHVSYHIISYKLPTKFYGKSQYIITQSGGKS